MLQNLQSELSFFIFTAKHNIKPVIAAISGLWLINLINWRLLGGRLNLLGIIPRFPIGLLGLIFSPILHANFNHLFFNSIPLFALTLFMLSYGVPTFAFSTLFIMFGSGFSVWLLGRRGIHIGASALISGYFAFVLISAYKLPSITTLFAAAIALYYFGGIFMGLLPSEESQSWEGHLSGFIAGLVGLLVLERYPYLKVWTAENLLSYFAG